MLSLSREIMDAVITYVNGLKVNSAPSNVLSCKAGPQKCFILTSAGVYYDAKGMEAIASIPSREELLSKLLGSIQSPIANFARCMNQLAEKGGAAGAAPAEEAKAEEPAAEAAPAEEAKVEEAAPVAEEAPAVQEAPAAETAEANAEA